MRPTVLVVDDDADLRRVLRGILEPLVFVVEAAGGEEALRALEREKAALMLVDSVMPGMDGLETLRRALAASPALTVVMLTGTGDLTLAHAALDSGAKAFITKPFDAQVIRREILALVGKGDEHESPPWRLVGD